MNKLMVAVVAGLMSVAFAGAYAADDTSKGSSDTTKSAKGKSSTSKDTDKSSDKSKTEKSKKGSSSTTTPPK